MKKLVAFCAIALLCGAMTGCDYDDSDLWNKIEEIDGRVDGLEKRVATTNSDLEALRLLVEALQENVTISAVETTGDGYTIRFSNGTTATISNGRDGVDAPVVSVKQDTDGVWYWTLDGEFITVDGRKLRVEGEKGADGAPGASGSDAVAPQVRIDADTKMWEISTDGGQTWTSTGVVAEGKDGGSVFADVDTASDADWVIFTLADGTVLRVARTAAFDFVIEGAASVERFKFGAGKSYRVTAAGVADYSISKPDGWRAAYADGVLTVTAPAAENVWAETSGEIVVHISSQTGSCKIVRMSVEALPYELRVLTFEDADYKGNGNMLGSKDWSSLIDKQQYGGPLLYPTDEELYRWDDENNTFLASEFCNNYGDYQFWGKGLVISDYVERDLKNGDFNHQLAIYYQDPATGFGGHGGSKNFCVQNGYNDDVNSTDGLPYIYFMDGEARVIDHLYVTNTTYFLNCIKNGNGFSQPFAQGDVSKLIVIGMGEDGSEAGRKEVVLAKDDNYTLESWEKVDISSFGKVLMVYFNITSTDSGAYGMNTPAYFAFDDVAVRFE